MCKFLLLTNISQYHRYKGKSQNKIFIQMFTIVPKKLLLKQIYKPECITNGKFLRK
jgi:hypothetical protein